MLLQAIAYLSRVLESVFSVTQLNASDSSSAAAAATTAHRTLLPGHSQTVTHFTDYSHDNNYREIFKTMYKRVKAGRLNAAFYSARAL